MTSTEAAGLHCPEAQQGTAAAVVNTAAQVGTALGVAVLLTIASVIEGEHGVQRPWLHGCVPGRSRTRRGRRRRIDAQPATEPKKSGPLGSRSSAD